MPAKKILILGKLPPPFMGPALATRIILDSSLKEKYQLLHIDTKAYDSLNELGKWSLKKIFRNNAIYFRMLRVCISQKPDLVLIPISQATTGFIKDSIFILIARITGRRVLLQLRGSDFKTWLSNSSKWMQRYAAFILRRTQGMIVLGKSLRHIFEEYYSPDKIYVVPNGANYNLTFTQKQNSAVRILYLANLQASKGIEDVLEAVKLLLKQGSGNFHLDVVGQWRSEETRIGCEKLVQENKLPITFHPADAGKKKMEFLSKADIFVFPPRAPEGHPWVIVEAMAAGLPVISTDRGAIAECILDGQNGFIVPVNNPEQLAIKMNLLISDNSLRERMGRESRRLYEENFTEEKMVGRLSETFEKAMA